MNYGLAVAALMFFALGILFTAIDVSVRRELARRNFILPTLYIGLSVFFLLESTQYNLRSSMRIIYYMLAIAFVTRIVRELKPRKTALPRASRGEARSPN